MARSSQEAIPEERECSGGSSGGPGVVGRASKWARSSREALLVG